MKLACPPSAYLHSSNDIPRADGSISKMAQCRCGCDHDNTSDQCLLLQLRNSPIPEKLENYFSPISAKPGTKCKRGEDKIEDEFVPSSEIEDDEALCMPGEEPEDPEGFDK
jgi:hypothetical protein